MKGEELGDARQGLEISAVGAARQPTQFSVGLLDA